MSAVPLVNGLAIGAVTFGMLSVLSRILEFPMTEAVINRCDGCVNNWKGSFFMGLNGDVPSDPPPLAC